MPVPMKRSYASASEIGSTSPAKKMRMAPTKVQQQMNNKRRHYKESKHVRFADHKNKVHTFHDKPGERRINVNKMCYVISLYTDKEAFPLWKKPQHISNLSPLIPEPGQHSTLKRRERTRQSYTPMARYRLKQDIPSTPGEPDFQDVERSPPIQIPLERVPEIETQRIKIIPLERTESTDEKKVIFCPQPITGLKPKLVEHGCKSEEKAIQKRRAERTMPILYLCNSVLPYSPEEPDPPEGPDPPEEPDSPTR